MSTILKMSANEEAENTSLEDICFAAENLHMHSELQACLTKQYTAVVQTGINQYLSSIQKQIDTELEKNQEEYKLKTIETNIEREKFINNFNETIGKIADQCQAEKWAEKLKVECDSVSKELEEANNKLDSKNVAVCTNEELNPVVCDVKEAYEKLVAKLNPGINDDLLHKLYEIMKMSNEISERKERYARLTTRLKTSRKKEIALKVAAELQQRKV